MRNLQLYENTHGMGGRAANSVPAAHNKAIISLPRGTASPGPVREIFAAGTAARVIRSRFVARLPQIRNPSHDSTIYCVPSLVSEGFDGCRGRAGSIRLARGNRT